MPLSIDFLQPMKQNLIFVSNRLRGPTLKDYKSILIAAGPSVL